MKTLILASFIGLTLAEPSYARDGENRMMFKKNKKNIGQIASDVGTGVVEAGKAVGHGAMVAAKATGKGLKAGAEAVGRTPAFLGRSFASYLEIRKEGGNYQIAQCRPLAAQAAKKLRKKAEKSDCTPLHEGAFRSSDMNACLQDRQLPQGARLSLARMISRYEKAKQPAGQYVMAYSPEKYSAFFDGCAMKKGREKAAGPTLRKVAKAAAPAAQPALESDVSAEPARATGHLLDEPNELAIDAPVEPYQGPKPQQVNATLDR